MIYKLTGLTRFGRLGHHQFEWFESPPVQNHRKEKHNKVKRHFLQCTMTIFALLRMCQSSPHQQGGVGALVEMENQFIVIFLQPSRKCSAGYCCGKVAKLL